MITSVMVTRQICQIHLQAETRERPYSVKWSIVKRGPPLMQSRFLKMQPLS